MICDEGLADVMNDFSIFDVQSSCYFSKILCFFVLCFFRDNKEYNESLQSDMFSCSLDVKMQRSLSKTADVCDATAASDIITNKHTERYTNLW